MFTSVSEGSDIAAEIMNLRVSFLVSSRSDLLAGLLETALSDTQDFDRSLRFSLPMLVFMQ